MRFVFSGGYLVKLVLPLSLPWVNGRAHELVGIRIKFTPKALPRRDHFDPLFLSLWRASINHGGVELSTRLWCLLGHLLLNLRSSEDCIVRLAVNRRDRPVE